MKINNGFYMSTVSDNHGTSKALDKIKWLFVFILVVFVIWGNFYFAGPNSVYQPNVVVRIIGVILVAVLALLLAITTQKGKSLISFAKESRMELRKVVWPTRKEAIQTTLLIAVITIVVGLCLWGLDTFFFWAISKLTVLGH